MDILVTGANGFIGRHLCAHLRTQGHRVKAVVRRAPTCALDADETLIAADAQAACADASLLAGVDCVVHLAARAHILNETGDPAAEFKQANVEATRQWAQAAGQHKVSRFVYLSSIGVHGNSTSGVPFSEDSTPAPAELYAASKLAAETALTEQAKAYGMAYVIIRPPLVYGPDAPGNFRLLLKLLATGLPLPFAAIRARRSLVSVWNLVDFIGVCVQHPQAKNQTFLVADGEDISLPEIFHYLGEGYGRRNWIMPFPLGMLRGLLAMLGKHKAFDKLAAELRIDSRKARTLLSWSPPLGVRDGMRRTGEAFRTLNAQPSPH